MKYKILYLSVFLPEISIEEIDEKELGEFIESYFGELFPSAVVPASAVDEVELLLEDRSDEVLVDILSRDHYYLVKITSKPTEGEYTRALIFFDERHNRFLGLWLVKPFV